MASNGSRNSQKDTSKRSAGALPILFISALAISACMAFGNPTLWTTAVQSDAVTPSSNSANGNSGTNSNDHSKQNNTSSNGKEVNDISSNMKVIGEYTAISQSEEADRIPNIALAAEAIDGTEIAPGETISFNDIVGDTENDERYVVAPVISGSVTGESKRGGGICQVTTALYLASLYSDMEIVERYPHSVAVDYALIGLDATVVFGEKDLRVKNTSEYPMRVEAKASGQTVTVSILGEPLEHGKTIEVTSKVMDEVVADDVEVSENQTAYHYTVESYRNYLVDGVKQESTVLSSDSYIVYKPAALSVTEGNYDPTK